MRKARWLALSLVAFGGCGVARDVVDIPVGAVQGFVPGSPTKPADLVELQQKLLRFADANQSSLTAAVEKLQQDGKAPDPRMILQLKLSLASATISIASGPNARENLVDLAVFVTLTRIAVEDHWQPKIFGDSGLPLLETCKGSEAEIWRLTAVLLTPAQQQELREAILAWSKSHPPTQSILAARTAGFAVELTGMDKDASKKSDSMLNFLNLDPLKGMDPAVREITQTRLFAERALFVAQKIPPLLRWQTELLSVNMLDLPQIRQLTAAVAQASASADRIAATTEKLPERVSKEREELVKALEGQEKALSPMVREVRQTVDAGTKMSESLNVTLKTFDELMSRLNEPGKGPPPEPFRIQDYTKAAAQAEATSKQLTAALATLDRILASGDIKTLSDQVAPAVERAEGGAKDVLDFAFRKAVLLVLAILAAALIYRIVTRRLGRPEKS